MEASGGTPFKPSEETKGAIAGAAIALAETQLLAQVADDASLDGRTTGLIGLNGALLVADFAIKGELGTLWFLPLIVVAASTAMLIPTLFGPDRRGSDVATRAALFYETKATVKVIRGLELLLAELNKAFDFNKARLERKRKRLQSALIVLLGGLVIAGVLIPLDQPTKVMLCVSNDPSHQGLQSHQSPQSSTRSCNSQSQSSRTPAPPVASHSGELLKLALEIEGPVHGILVEIAEMIEGS
jgi:hypothetical protein